MTLSEWLDYYMLECKKPFVKPTTYINYSLKVENHIKPAIGHHKLKLLRKDMVQAFVNRLSAKGLAPSTVVDVYKLLRNALETTLDDGLIALPFDISAVRTFEYDLTDIDSVDETKERLQRTIQSISYPTSDGECNDDDIEAVPQIPDTVPILYQILDAISELKTEVKNNNSETIKAVISSLQSSQPSMSAETALQVKMLEGLIQNPTNFMKLLELSQKLPQQKK